MHYHLELIMPPTENIKEAVKQILEEYEVETPHPNNHAFYDWYVIGGRWSGIKVEAVLGENRIEAFRTLLEEKHVTVSGLVCGKEELLPIDQIAMVDALWNKFFPDAPIKTCPLFAHYKEDYGDVMTIAELPKDLTASRVIIARHHWKDINKFEAEYMLAKELWNGCTWQDTTFDGNVKKALDGYIKRIENMPEDFKKDNTPKDDWLCVTIDYHS